mmetsp:Transcript_49861/g.132416  ORF Transcript_49861/g.132416 Transcript_49861/m.132416 type:complete len:272 (+) Transcript_49861:812-1627(+)
MLDLDRRTESEVRLSREDVAAVIVDAVNGRGHWRRYPSCGGSRHELLKLGLVHRFHVIGFGPHALSDLASAGQARPQAHIHIRSLVGLDPRCLPHLRLGHDGSSVHASVNLVTRPVQETCVDEEDALRTGTEALAKVHAGTPLLIHQSHLDGVPLQAEHLLHPRKDPTRQLHLGRTVHLRFHDVDGPRPAVRQAARASQIVECGHHRDEAVQEAFWHLSHIRHDGIGEHVMPDVPNEAHCAAGQCLGHARWVTQRNVALHTPDQRLLILGK